MKIYRPEAETEVHTDASQDGYGAVLMQRSSDDGQMRSVYTSCFEIIEVSVS